MIEQAKEAVAEVYTALGMAPTKSREQRHVKVRSAIGVCLSSYMSDADAGKVIEKDRTTIIHYRDKHPTNIKTWAGYDEIYKLAKGIISVSLDSSMLKVRVHSIKARIKMHENEIAKLQKAIEPLESKLQYS